MFRTPQKRGGAANLFRSPHQSPHKTLPLNGFFSDGIWKCNCEPRLPASHFQVKKESKNQGRWFYTCQKPKETGCGFFLWDDDTVGREMSAVIDNSRTEPEGLRTPADAKRKDDAEPLAGKKWIHSLVKADQNEFGAFALTMEEAEEVVGKVEQPRTQRCPETPRKAIKTETFITPGSKRKWEEEALPTPVTGVVKDEDVFTASNRRLEENMWGGNEHFGLRSPSATPTPSRFRDISEVGEPMGKPKIEYDISKDVMELLRNHKIDDDTRDSLLKMLRKHTVKMSGIAKGRDISRAALKAKDTQIAELQQKITALEAEREMDKTIIRHFKSDMAQSIASKRSRGRGRGNS